MNNNKSLFWYGFRARLKKLCGLMFIIVGVIFGFIGLVATETLIIILSVGGLIFGFYLLFTGARNEYDYKRQGGYIVYND